ncbi:MAG TPA: hypothetical protein VJK52_04080, partial [Candidatus Nanoarchaeia archaeon]|nr:hypothetical protein [Candidatus Nanoarchaeia archaeon]
MSGGKSIEQWEAADNLIKHLSPNLHPHEVFELRQAEGKERKHPPCTDSVHGKQLKGMMLEDLQAIRTNQR